MKLTKRQATLLTEAAATQRGEVNHWYHSSVRVLVRLGLVSWVDLPRVAFPDQVSPHAVITEAGRAVAKKIAPNG